MAKRKIIKIDTEKCNGCGVCIPNCPEGALQIIDGKARLISDLFCDGLGACIGHCPQGAITTQVREAVAYDERKVMANIVTQGENVIKAHLMHLKGHGEEGFLREALGYLKEKHIEVSLCDDNTSGHHSFPGCPGSRTMDLRNKEKKDTAGERTVSYESQLAQWPVQITLVPVSAPYFKNADLLIAADCVPFAYPQFHDDLLKGKIVLVGCPKLDDVKFYEEKITQILKDNTIKSVTYAHMEVPCCFGLISVIKNALSASGKQIPFKEVVIGIQGERLQ
ncbi:MAG: 4Fe-4S dicluster domain-containing protein [Candidatus Omnitrophota bacterium]|jgi:ferredoxin|nr:MAG: 4Fe-4S dicluster domain-containing protein [Candidatus Omnitrophota bacterium]